MSLAILTMPKLGETMEEGRIAGWVQARGAPFARGDVLLEIETDKTVAEYPALGAGTLVELLVAPGDLVAVGAPIARVEVTGAPWLDVAEGAMTPGLIEVDFVTPTLGETTTEAKVVSWLVAPGQSFARGDVLLEVETDKTIAEIPAMQAGELRAILVPEGEVAATGAPLARIAVAGDAAPPPAAAPATATAPATPAAPRHAPVPVAASRQSQPERPRATPLARRIAAQNDVDLAEVAGSGRRGRIEKADVLAHIAAREAVPVAVVPVAVAPEQAVPPAPVHPDAPLAYEVTGRPGGRPVLMLHGFSADRRGWNDLAHRLREGRWIVAPDLPGHGATEAGAERVGDLIAPVTGFAAEALPEGAFDLVAHSMGALVAVALARALPGRVASLTLIAPAGLGAEIDGDFVAGMAGATSRAELIHCLRRAGPMGPLSDAFLDAQIAAGRRLGGLAGDLVGPFGQRHEILRGLAALPESLPLRVIFGTEDRIIPWTQVRHLPPRVAVHLIEGAEHMPHVERAEAVAALLSRWL